MTACLIHALLQAEPGEGFEAHVVVLYPQDNVDIRAREYEKVHLGERIGKRLAEYKEAGDSTPEIQRFEAGWEEMLGRIGVQFGLGARLLARCPPALCLQFRRLSSLGKSMAGHHLEDMAGPQALRRDVSSATTCPAPSTSSLV